MTKPGKGKALKAWALVNVDTGDLRRHFPSAEPQIFTTRKWARRQHLNDCLSSSLYRIVRVEIRTLGEHD